MLSFRFAVNCPAVWGFCVLTAAMSAADEVLLPSSDSFWEIDCYKTTVKRTEDGLHMCGELMKLIAERSEIEMKYSSKLKMWCKKWSEIIDKGFIRLSSPFLIQQFYSSIITILVKHLVWETVH